LRYYDYPHFIDAEKEGKGRLSDLSIVKSYLVAVLKFQYIKFGSESTALLTSYIEPQEIS
jgi:hypothetical protein